MLLRRKYEAILEAIQDRDPEVAELYAKRHIHLIHVDLKEILKK